MRKSFKILSFMGLLGGVVFSSSLQRIDASGGTGVIPSRNTGVLQHRNIDMDLRTSAEAYSIGDDFDFTVRKSQDSHLYVFSFEPGGVARQLYPNAYEPESLITNDVTVRFPRQNYEILVKGEEHNRTIVAFSTSMSVSTFEVDYSPTSKYDPFPVRIASYHQIKKTIEIALDAEIQSRLDELNPNQEVINIKRLGVPSFGEDSVVVNVQLPKFKTGKHDDRVILDRQAYYHGEERFVDLEEYESILPNYKILYGTRFNREETAPVNFRVSCGENNAEVFLDHQYIGKTPLNVDIYAGSYDLVVRKPGFQPYREQHIVARDGETKRLNFRLDRDQ